MKKKNVINGFSEAILKIIEEAKKYDYIDEVMVGKLLDIVDNTQINEPLNYYWSRGKWKQPPVKIKHGDLVYITHKDYIVSMLGRYIGDGYGVVELYDYSTGIKHVVGKVEGRGMNKNPRLISDEKLFEFINDSKV